jgi:alanine-glyoxylate transaminase / serine-glyoxylate transaminase / serine-pyruvate transaminase
VIRYDRFAAATRAAVERWGLEILATDPAERSSVLTAVMVPDGHDADRFRELTLERFDLSLGAGLARLKGRVFRIGHLGDLNDLTLAGTLAGVEGGLGLAGVPIRTGGVEAALQTMVELAV